MSTAHRQRSKPEREVLKARVIELRKANPELTATDLSRRLGIRIETISDYCRAAGVPFAPRRTHGEA